MSDPTADHYARFAPQPPPLRQPRGPAAEDVGPDPEPSSRRRRSFGPYSTGTLAGVVGLLLTLGAVGAAIRLDRQAAERARAARARFEAEQTVAELVRTRIDERLLRADVLSDLRTDSTIPEPVRTQALALAENYREDATRLNNVSWSIVVQPGASSARRRWALRLAETACQLQADDGYALNTLGAAQYRNGQFAEALETLVRSEELNRDRHGESHPADLAFLAMTHQRLGDGALARQCLNRLSEAMTRPQWLRNGDELVLLFEASAVVPAPAP